MSTGASKETLAYFVRGQFWEGIVAFCNERERLAQKASLASATWDDANRAKGSAAEIGVLRRLLLV